MTLIEKSREFVMPKYLRKVYLHMIIYLQMFE